MPRYLLIGGQRCGQYVDVKAGTRIVRLPRQTAFSLASKPIDPMTSIDWDEYEIRKHRDYGEVLVLRQIFSPY